MEIKVFINLELLWVMKANYISKKLNLVTTKRTVLNAILTFVRVSQGFVLQQEKKSQSLSVCHDPFSQQWL